MSDMRLVVAGAAGRMGRTVIKAIAETDGVVLAGAIETPGAAVIGCDAGELAGLGRNGIAVSAEAPALLAQTDGLIDFTIPAATIALAGQSTAHSLVHIIGTTGLTAAHEEIIAAAASRARIVKSGSMSLGVNLLAALVKRVAKTLDDEFDIEIFEMHHNKKIDAPSGTALLLGAAAAAGRDVDFAGHSVRVRDGHTGARKAGNIGFASLRGGTVVGEHSVIFARGAVKAALWARDRKPGLYSMADVLGLSEM